MIILIYMYIYIQSLNLEGMIINPLQWFEPVTPSTMELGLLS